jgi:hypothetical protein
MCLARWNARLSAATRDLHKGPTNENENSYIQDTGNSSEDDEIGQSEGDKGSTSSEVTDNELELAPVSNPEDTNLDTQNRLDGPLGLNDPDLYDTDSGYETDAEDGISRQGGKIDTPYNDFLDETMDNTDPCPEVDESAESVIIDLFPRAAEVIHTGDPPFSTLVQEQCNAGRGNIYYPFAGPVEWDLARWLHGAGSMAMIDQFLKLKYVSTRKYMIS